MKKLAKKSIICLSACMVMASTAAVSANPTYKTNIQLVVQGQPIALDQLSVYTDAQNRTLVPLRFLSEAFGAMVHWDRKARTATVYQHPFLIELKVGDKEATVKQLNEEHTVMNESKKSLDTEARLMNGRLYVPMQFIIEQFLGDSEGSVLNWNGYTNTLSMNIAKLRDPMVLTLLEMKSNIEKAVPRLAGNVFINSETNDVLINLRGDGSIDHISIGIRVQRKDVADPDDREKLKFDRIDRVLVSKPKDKATQQALREILKLYFPASYEKAYQSIMQMKRSHVAYDQKTMTIEPAHDVIHLWINYPEKPGTAFDKGIVDMQREADYTTALLDAAKGGVVDIVRILLEQGGANPRMIDIQGENALMKAAEGGHLEIVKLLHETYGLDINSQNVIGDTALMMAVGNGDIEMVKYLLVNGANPNINNQEHETALMKAVRGGNLEIVKLLMFNK